MWEELYKGIGRTNAVIDRINDATLSEDFANGIIYHFLPKSLSSVLAKHCALLKTSQCFFQEGPN
jgi:hypothetical protein